MNHFFKGNYIRWWLKNVASHTGKQKIQPSSYNSHCSYPPTVHPQGIQDGEKQDTAPRELKVCISCSVVSDSLQDHGLQPARLLCPWNSGKNTGLGSYSLLQGIFLTQGLNLGLLNCRQILYHLSHQGSPSNQRNIANMMGIYTLWLHFVTM